jgi:hypothetical protein
MLSFMAAFWTLGNLFVACESQDAEEFCRCILSVDCFLEEHNMTKTVWFYAYYFINRRDLWNNV